MQDTIWFNRSRTIQKDFAGQQWGISDLAPLEMVQVVLLLSRINLAASSKLLRSISWIPLPIDGHSSLSPSSSALIQVITAWRHVWTGIDTHSPSNNCHSTLGPLTYWHKYLKRKWNRESSPKRNAARGKRFDATHDDPGVRCFATFATVCYTKKPFFRSLFTSVLPPNG